MPRATIKFLWTVVRSDLGTLHRYIHTPMHANTHSIKYLNKDFTVILRIFQKCFTVVLLTYLQSTVLFFFPIYWCESGRVLWNAFHPLRFTECTLWCLWLTPQRWRGWRWRGGHTETLHSRWTSAPAELFRSLGSSDTYTHTHTHAHTHTRTHAHTHKAWAVNSSTYCRWEPTQNALW